MRKNRIITLLLIFFASLFNAQTSDWTEIKKNYFQKVISENSQILVKENDRIELSTFEIEKTDGKIESFEFGKFFFGDRPTYEELKMKLDIKSFEPSLKKVSEYLIKIYIPKERFYVYHIYLNDSIKSSELKNLQKFLTTNYQIEKIVYVSKEEAAKIAREEIGINSAELFEENIFPASIDITSENPINTKKIQEKFPKLIDDLGSNEREIKSMTLKIKT